MKVDEIKSIKKCKICGIKNRRFHNVEINTCIGHNYRYEILCCKCVYRLENWLDGKRMVYNKDIK